MYADIDDVRREMGEFESFLTNTSKPSEGDVTNEILPGIAGDIDGVLSSRGLTVPVTTPADFVKALGALNALGAAARAVAALAPHVASRDGVTGFHEWLQKRFDAKLDSLRAGEGIPTAAIPTGGGYPRSYATSHPDDETTEPVFKRGTAW